MVNKLNYSVIGNTSTMSELDISIGSLIAIVPTNLKESLVINCFGEILTVRPGVRDFVTQTFVRDSVHSYTIPS